MSTRKHSKDKDTLMATNPAPTPCDTVLDIQELQDLIFGFIGHSSTEDLKRCLLVCRRWQGYAEPHAWKSLTIGGKSSKDRIVLRQKTRMLVRRLTITSTTRAIVKMIPELFPNVNYLDLTIGFGSDGIGYSHLLKLFIHMQDRLTEVQISLETTVYNVSILWSLASLSRLTHLRLKVNYPPDYHNVRFADHVRFADKTCHGLLKCCPILQSLEIHFGEGNLHLHYTTPVHCRVWRWVQQRVDYLTSLGAPTPSTLQEALVRSSSKSPIPWFRRKQSVQKRVSNLFSPRATEGDISGNTTNLRRLCVNEVPAYALTLRNVIITHGSQLTELVAKGHHLYSIQDDDWRLILAQCRLLRILDIADCGRPPPPFTSLISSLPHLQVLHIGCHCMSAQYPPPFLSNLGAGLEEHRLRYGTEHPLKYLDISGWMDRPDKVLMDILALRPSQLESVRVCIFHKPNYGVQLFSSIASTSAASSLLSPPSTLTTTGRDLKDTLVRLDLSYTPFSDHSQGIQLFEYLQELRRLQVLYIAAGHARILVRIHKDNTNATNANTNTNLLGDNTSDSCYQQQLTRHDLPATELCFLSVTDLYICYDNYSYRSPTPSDVVTRPVALLFVAMMPSLRYFSLEDRAVLGVKSLLEERFRRIRFEGDRP